jgi:hypothetical protein
VIQTAGKCLNQDLQDFRMKRIEEKMSESGFAGFMDEED